MFKAMEVDRILYIFGSFTRKKDKRKSLGQSSISAGNSPLNGVRINRPISQNLNVPPRTSAYEDKIRKSVKEWECKLCSKELVEPRLLGCLHSFCTRCLQAMPQEGEPEAWSEVDGGSAQTSGELKCTTNGGSAGSGYESDIRRSGSDGSWELQPRKFGIMTRKVSGKSVQYVVCPTCGHETPLPLGGIAALPLNYVLLRKMMANDDSVSILCDLCTTDNKAENRCKQCLVSICSACGEAHHRQRSTARHSLHPIDPPPVSFCTYHPKAELSVYCASCQQVICRDCSVISHSGHALGSASRAAEERARRLRAAGERARRLPEHAARALTVLHQHAYEVDSEAASVEAEIESWAEEYKRAVAAHARSLRAAAARARDRHRLRVDRAHRDIEDRAKHATDAVTFADELLTLGKEAEVLSLSGPVLSRLESLTDSSAGELPRLQLRFNPRAPATHHCSLYGRLITEPPDPNTSVLHTEGFQDLKVNQQHEAVLELRDTGGERIWCGGEQVSSYFRRRDSSARPAVAAVTDRGDGSYSIAFTPATPGAYLLAVILNNQPIKGSPFPCCARVGVSHRGVFHCCAFCSSGGDRKAVCGCGGTMPGGYKGCGHGHAGWPGARHWSCCGNTRRAADCTARGHKLYQFSL